MPKQALIVRKRGRPCTYSSDIAETICARLAAGESLNALCKDDGFPPESTVRLWVLDDHDGFAAKYARARDIGLDVRADAMEAKILAEPDTQRARLLWDNDRWYLSKLAPKRYGDALNIKGDMNVNITMAQRILEAREACRAGGCAPPSPLHQAAAPARR